MEILVDIAAAQSADQPVVVVPGSFDGVHLGHQTLIRTARDLAETNEGEVWILTLDPHPSRVLRPDSPAPQLMTTSQKLKHLERRGVDRCLLLPFTRTFSEISAEDFIQRLTGGNAPVSDIVIGPNYRFGRKAEGCAALLEKRGPEFGYRVHAVPPVEIDNGMVSSSRIREEIIAGAVDRANRLLGHAFSVTGPVGSGKQLGRQLGYPTANIACLNDVRPAPGVYAVYAEWNGDRIHGAGYFAPDPSPHIFEAHFFDFDADLYERELEVFFEKKMRDNIRFDNHEDLVAQIDKDVAETRALFGV